MLTQISSETKDVIILKHKNYIKRTSEMIEIEVLRKSIIFFSRVEKIQKWKRKLFKLYMI